MAKSKLEDLLNAEILKALSHLSLSERAALLERLQAGDTAAIDTLRARHSTRKPSGTMPAPVRRPDGISLREAVLRALADGEADSAAIIRAIATIRPGSSEESIRAEISRLLRDGAIKRSGPKIGGRYRLAK